MGEFYSYIWGCSKQAKKTRLLTNYEKRIKLFIDVRDCVCVVWYMGTCSGIAPLYLIGIDNNRLLGTSLGPTLSKRRPFIMLFSRNCEVEMIK